MGFGLSGLVAFGLFILGTCLRSIISFLVIRVHQEVQTRALEEPLNPKTQTTLRLLQFL